MTTIEVWQCTICAEYNLLSMRECAHCHNAQSSVSRLAQIATSSPAAAELLGITAQAPQIAPKQAKSAKKSKTSAKAKVNEELDLEETFLQYWNAASTGYEFVRQYRGIVKRIDKKGKPVMTNHRFDFALPDYMLAIEIQGGIFSRGRHVRPKGYHDDRAKIRKAILQGWTVLEYTTIDIKQGLHIAVAEILERIAQVENSQSKRKVA